GDSGATWRTVAMIVGDGPSWYPLRVDLLQAAGHRGARVRFIAEQFSWWVDAVGFATDASPAFVPLAVAAGAEVSENPVRGNQVVVAWPPPAGAGDARVSILDRKSTRLNSSHLGISYAVFCL